MRQRGRSFQALLGCEAVTAVCILDRLLGRQDVRNPSGWIANAVRKSDGWIEASSAQEEFEVALRYWRVGRVSVP